MGKYDKLIKKLLNNPKDICFEELKKVLNNNGYIETNTGGSHYVFRKDGFSNITIPRKKPIKIVYIKHVIIELRL